MVVERRLAARGVCAPAPAPRRVAVGENRVHPDPELGALDGEGPDEAVEPALRGRVVRESAHAEHAPRSSSCRRCARAPGRASPRRPAGVTQNAPFRWIAEHLVDLADGEILEVRVAQDARVVDDDVDGAEPVDGRRRRVSRPPSGVATDTYEANASPPAAWISPTTASASGAISPSPPMSLTTTLAPRAARAARAWARPRPRPAPVTIATRPAREMPGVVIGRSYTGRILYIVPTIRSVVMLARRGFRPGRDAPARRRGGMCKWRRARSSSSRQSAPPIGRGHAEKGQFKDVHPNTLLGATYTEVLKRAGARPAEGRRRDRRLRAAVRRAVVQRRPQRLAAGGPPVRGAGGDDRPPVRLGPAGGQLPDGDDRLRRDPTSRSAPASSTWAASRCSSAASSPTTSARRGRRRCTTATT